MNLPQDNILDSMSRLADGSKPLVNSDGTPVSSYLGDSMDVPIQDDVVFGDDRTQVRRAAFTQTVFTRIHMTPPPADPESGAH